MEHRPPNGRVIAVFGSDGVEKLDGVVVSTAPGHASGDTAAS